MSLNLIPIVIMLNKHDAINVYYLEPMAIFMVAKKNFVVYIEREKKEFLNENKIIKI